MTSIIKVDTLQTAAGAAPTAGSLGLASGSVVKVTRLQTSTETVNNSQSYVTVWDASYTPILPNSRIIFHWTLRWRCTHSGGAEKRFDYLLNVNGSQAYVNIYNGLYTYTGDGNWNKADYTSSYEYTNTTGNSVALQFRGKNIDSASSLVFNDEPGDIGVLTITELVT